MSSKYGRKFYNCPFVRYFCALTATLPLIASCGPEAKFVGMSPTPIKSLAATSFVMSIDPTDAKITEGEFQKFRVYISDETQTKREITTDVSWSISDDKIALISPIEKGSFKGLAQGETAVTANFEGKKIIGTLHVQALPVKIIKGNPIVSLAISPQNPALSVGNALQLYAEATYTDGTKKDATKLSNWTSNSASILTIDNQYATKGLVKGLTIGTSNVVANFDGVSASANVQVNTNPIDLIPPSLQVGKKVRVCFSYDRVKIGGHNCDRAEFKVSIFGVNVGKINLNNGSTGNSVEGGKFESAWDATGSFKVSIKCDLTGCHDDVTFLSIIGEVEDQSGTKKWLKIDQGKILPGVDYNYKFRDFTLSDKEIDFGALCTTILK